VNSSYVATVPSYPGLPKLIGAAHPGTSWESHLAQKVVPYLVAVWLRHYRLALSGGEVVEVNLDPFSYLFDIGPDRLISAWGISKGRFAGQRDNSRMQGFPVASRPVYHAGHAIPHRLGGGTDINLTAQLGSVNVGPFRELENRAVKAPGALYFTYWMYHRAAEKKIQLASRVQQGLLIRGSQPEIRDFKN